MDHHSGTDAWQGLSVQERAAIARRMPELCAQLAAQVADPTPLAGYARIDVPVWLLTGDRTRAAAERIARLLAGALPRADWRRIDAADRMGLGPHPEAVDREIEAFLDQQHPTWHRVIVRPRYRFSRSQCYTDPSTNLEVPPPPTEKVRMRRIERFH